MAAKTKRTKAPTETKPVTITAGGDVYELIPPDQWTAQQDDKATGLLLRIAPSLQSATEGVDQDKAMYELVISLVESGEYRKMLALAFRKKGEVFNPDDITANAALFETVRFPPNERLTAATEAVKAFFGSATS